MAYADIDNLLQLLKSPDPEVRADSVKKISVYYDERIVQPLLACLTDEDETVRKATCEAFGNLNLKIAVEPLIERLEDPIYMVRFNATQALGKIKDPRAVLPVIERLKDGKRWVRHAACQALGKLGDSRAVIHLIERLDDSFDKEKTMRYFFAVLIILIPLFTGSCEESAKAKHGDLSLGSTNSTDKKVENKKGEGAFSKDAPMPSPIYTLEPLAIEYFQSFLDSEVIFPMVYIDYDMGIDAEHLTAISEGLAINTHPLYLDKVYFINQNLNDLQDFYAYYGDNDWKSFECDLDKTLVIPLFDLFLEQQDYFFNGEEYGGEESLEIGTGHDFGLRNFIMMRIFLPDQKIAETGTAKAFCKGWDPGDDPPVELVPVLNYLENVLIPEMRNHPYP